MVVVVQGAAHAVGVAVPAAHATLLVVMPAPPAGKKQQELAVRRGAFFLGHKWEQLPLPRCPIRASRQPASLCKPPLPC